MMTENSEILEPFYYLSKPCTLGEGPIYRYSDHTLHYVDCLSNPPQLHILKLDTTTGDAANPSKDISISSIYNKNTTIPGLRVIDLEDSVTVQYFRKNHPGSYICAYYQGIAFLNEETGKLDILKEIIPISERHIRRFNDGAVDCKGRFWAAEIDVKGLSYGAKHLPKNYGKPLGRLWRYDPDGSLHKMEDGLVCGNGLAWSPDNKTMYLNDSVAQKIYSYDFDEETGNISNKILFVDEKESSAEPDGMVCDIDGNLWVAVFNGNGINVYNPKGEKIKFVKLNAKSPACTTWGGKTNSTIFVVSALNKSNPGSDAGGHLFKFDAGIKGIKKYEFGG